MRILLALALVIAAFVGAIVAASELGGEVVVITTTDEREVPYETSLWVVEYRGSPYLRAGDRDSAWFQRLRRNGTIEVTRRGERATYRAVPDPASTEQISALMARDYGLADQLIGLVRDPTKSVAIRLERVKR